MTQETLVVRVPPVPPEPRAAAPAAAIAVWVDVALHALARCCVVAWHEMERMGSLRARRELRQLKLVRAGGDPELAQALHEAEQFLTGVGAQERAVREAADARRLAWRYRDTDPRLASEINAAADRHELQHGTGANPGSPKA